jgi:hypothetical protein
MSKPLPTRVEIRITRRNGARQSVIVSRKAFAAAWRAAHNALFTGDSVVAIAHA